MTQRGFASLPSEFSAPTHPSLDSLVVAASPHALFAVATSGRPKSPQTRGIVCGSPLRRPKCAQTGVHQTQTMFVPASRHARKPQTKRAGSAAGVRRGFGGIDAQTLSAVSPGPRWLSRALSAFRGCPFSPVRARHGANRRQRRLSAGFSACQKWQPQTTRGAAEGYSPYVRWNDSIRGRAPTPLS